MSRKVNVLSRVRRNMVLTLRHSTELTIAAGAITVAASSAAILYRRVDTEANAATDDLTAINGGVVGQVLIIQTAAHARDTAVTASGTLRLDGGFPSSFVLNRTQDKAMFICTAAGTWEQIAPFSNNLD